MASGWSISKLKNIGLSDQPHLTRLDPRLSSRTSLPTDIVSLPYWYAKKDHILDASLHVISIPPVIKEDEGITCHESIQAEEDFVTIECDGACNRELGTASYGAILIDVKGIFGFCFGGSEFLPSSQVYEFESAKHGLLLAKKGKAQAVDLVMDCKNVLEIIQSTEPIVPPNYHTIITKLAPMNTGDDEKYKLQTRRRPKMTPREKLKSQETRRKIEENKLMKSVYLAKLSLLTEIRGLVAHFSKDGRRIRFTSVVREQLFGADNLTRFTYFEGDGPHYYLRGSADFVIPKCVSHIYNRNIKRVELYLRFSLQSRYPFAHEKRAYMNQFPSYDW